MTVANTIRIIKYDGNGTLTVFKYPFKLVLDTHAIVTIVVDSTGIGTTQVITTDYSVSNVGENDGGNITMVVAPASGETLVIERTPPLTQLLDLRSQGSFPPEAIENAFDLMIMIIQAVAVGDLDGAGIDPRWPVSTEAAKPSATATQRGKPYTVRDAGGNEHGEIVYQKRDGTYTVHPLFDPFS